MPKKPEPQELPGVEGPGVSPVKFRDVDRLADEFQELLESRAKISEDITATEKKLAEKLVEHELTSYKYRDQVVSLKPGKTHVRIKKVKSEGVSPGEDSDD